ncbi:alpha/beta hydrolase [Streptomyces sp. NPDC047315]|uniref:alpha/beta hydrolase n=1 Tax=Streptomyces sp. NPDC047315 TaxID=3155142 RepID=UPI00340E63A8
MNRGRADAPAVGRLAAAGLVGAGVVAAGAGVRAALRLGSRPGPYGSLVGLPGGRRFHALWQHGAPDGPTVVFENALVCSATEWKWVIDALGPDTSYLAYDRAGTGWTPPNRGGADIDAYTTSLRELLHALRLPAPYVLVGHSVGGLLIRAFTARHPDLVAGLVFVDSSHPDQWARSEVQRTGMPWIRQRLLTHVGKAMLGLHGSVTQVSETSSLPDGAGAATAALLDLPGPWLGAYREAQQVETAWSESARSLTSVAPKPVAVVTAGETVRRDPVHRDLQGELAALSNRHRHTQVDEASHESVVMRAAHAVTVTEAVRWAVDLSDKESR